MNALAMIKCVVSAIIVYICRSVHLTEAIARSPGPCERGQPSSLQEIHCRMPETGLPRNHQTM